MSELQEHVLVEKQPARHLRENCVHESHFSAIDVAFRSAIGWPNKVWHSEVDLDPYLQVVRHLYAYPCFYCYYFVSAADVRTHILADHINNQPFKITIKKESDDDG